MQEKRGMLPTALLLLFRRLLLTPLRLFRRLLLTLLRLLSNLLKLLPSNLVRTNDSTTPGRETWRFLFLSLASSKGKGEKTKGRTCVHPFVLLSRDCLFLVQSEVNSHCDGHGSTHHGVVANTEESHHLNVCRNRRRTCELSIAVHTTHCVGHTV